MSEVRLWEAKHLYDGCQTGNYLAGGDEAHLVYGSWAEFVTDTADAYFGNDENLVYRWDWLKPDPADYRHGEELPSAELRIFVVQQYQAYNFSFGIAVTEEDEPQIAEWLAERAKKLIQTWHPLLERIITE